MALYHTLSANVEVTYIDPETFETIVGHVSGNEGDNIYIVRTDGNFDIKKDVELTVNE